MDWPYQLCRLGGRFIFFCTMRLELIRPEAALRHGPHLIACSHIGNLDPFLLSVIVPRNIDWVTRVEFFRRRPTAWLLRRLNAIKVRRFGVPVSTIRTSIDRLKRGRIVGICPEGGVCRGSLSCMKGAPVRRGVGLIAYRAGVPVLPCVMLGSDHLNRVSPWLPFRRARLWVAFGDRVITPRTDLDRKSAREQLTQELQQEYVKLFAELSSKYGFTAAVLGERSSELSPARSATRGAPGYRPRFETAEGSTSPSAPG
jgi:1-acyl-sn-glycerol-3-phosphate acyltransferase